MTIEITMPALSPTMEEGNLAKWLIKEGDVVSSGDVIAEIETDKATMEVEAVDEGTIARIVVDAGTEGVKVNSVIALLAEDGEDVAVVAAGKTDQATANSPSHSKTADVETGKASIVTGGASAASPALVTPLAKRIAAQNGIDLAFVDGTGARGKIVKADVDGSATSASPPQQISSGPSPIGSDGTRLFASPFARATAAANEIDLSKIAGSGPNGRVITRDVDAAIAGGTAKIGTGEVTADVVKPAKDTKAVQLAAGPSDEAVLKLYNPEEYETLRHDGMRKIIASRLTESTQTIPAYFITVECKLDPLLSLRAQMNDAAPVNEDKPAWKISVNDLIVKAMAMALRDVPMANASWTSTDRILHKHSDVGVAVAIPDGLFTPIVRKAEQKTLSVISNEIKDMAGRARKRKLAPEEYQGGSTAVSNLGMFGVKEFTSIINPPHASILSIGAGEKRAVVINDELAMATMMSATFAFDHRVIDGALGAELAAAFRGYVEKPAAMLA